MWKELERSYCRKKSQLCAQSRVLCYVSYGGADETRRFGMNLSKKREMSGQMYGMMDYIKLTRTRGIFCLFLTA